MIRCVPDSLGESVVTGMQWYYRRGDKRGGPVDHDAMCRLVAAGRLPPDAVVFRKGFDAFVPAASVEGFRQLLNPVTPTPHATVVATPTPGADPWSPPLSLKSSPQPAPSPTRSPDTDP